MHANSMCISCLLSKREKGIRDFSDEDKKSRYMQRVLEILCEYGQSESAPWISAQLNQLHGEFWGEGEDYAPIKHQYNQLLLGLEGQIDRRIDQAEDPLKECIKYVCAGNYIDFGAVSNVNRDTLEELLEKAAGETVSREEYDWFCRDLAGAKRLVYLMDNCGEIVLDKLFIRRIRERFPKLQITAVVRGEDVLNDATMVDAEEVGLTELVPCVGNGTAIPGTVLKELSPQARQLLEDADLVISKGQGNFESLYGEGVNPYFLFLCKCEMYVRRFGLPRYASVFLREERMQVK